MNRRNVLLGMGTVAAGTGAVFGSGAFTQVESERDLTIGIDDDSSALIGIKAGANVASVYESDSGDTAGELVIDTDELSGGDEGFAVGSTVDIGDIENGDVADGGEAFTVTNNFDDVGGGTGDIDIAIDLTGIDLGEVSGLSSLEFYGTGPNETQVTSARGRRVYNVSTDETIDFAIRFTTASTTGPKGLDAATVTFQAGSDLTSDDFPATQPADTVTRSIDGAEFSTIQGAVDDSGTTSGETLRVGAGTFDESVTIDVEGLTLEGPNAGIDGTGERGSEATIEGPVFVEADNVTVDGFEIQDVNAAGNTNDPSGIAAVQLNTLSGGGADGTTVANNVINNTAEFEVNYGVTAEGVTDVTIEGNYFVEKTDSSTGITGFESTLSFDIKDNTFENSGAGLNVPSGITATVSNNQFKNNSFGIAALAEFDSLTIENNKFTDNGGVTAYVRDDTGDLDLNTIESNNNFPDGTSGDNTNGQINP